jgi:hypothetical protein
MTCRLEVSKPTLVVLTVRAQALSLLSPAEVAEWVHEGDNLVLAPDKNVVKKRIKAFSFARSGANAPVEKEGPQEGDVLDLEPEAPGEKDKDQRGYVSFHKQQGRGDGLSRPLKQAWNDDEAVVDGYGDVLQLEVKREITERAPVAPSFGRVARWADKKEEDTIEGQGAIRSHPRPFPFVRWHSLADCLVRQDWISAPVMRSYASLLLVEYLWANKSGGGIRR